MKKIGFFITVLCVIWQGCIREKEDAPKGIENYVIVGDTIPEFIVYNANRDSLHSSELRGKNSMIFFFSTTCPDCQRELPKIETVWKELSSWEDFQLLAISRGQQAPVINKYWEEHALTFPFYLDPQREIFTMFANSYIPRIYLVRPDGTVKWMAIEEIGLSAEEMVEEIKN